MSLSWSLEARAALWLIVSCAWLPGCSSGEVAGDAGSAGTGSPTAGSAGRTGAGAGSPAAGSPAALGCQPGAGTANLSVQSLRVRGEGSTPAKGDALSIQLTVANHGGGARKVKLTPLLDSQRFSDYRDVELGSTELTLCEGMTEVTIKGGPFFSGRPPDRKQYALGSGRYTISGVVIAVAGQDERIQRDLPDNELLVASNQRVLVPVVYDARYLEAIEDHTFTTPEAYLRAAFTRPNQIFTPSGSDPNGTGAYQDFEGGFDAMMKVQHLFHAFPGFPGEKTTDQGWCEDAAAYAQRVLGMTEPWGSAASETRPERHGFDYLIALTPDMGGGVACGWLDVQVSSLIDRDVDRQQVIAVHESGHIFGAPHCDDVGDGQGGSLQGYVMCSGEKHEHYPEDFVWHVTSTQQMKPHWN